jgi:hypothetical protein
MTAADEVSKIVQTAITEARNLIAAKNLEIRKFDAKNAKAYLALRMCLVSYFQVPGSDHI